MSTIVAGNNVADGTAGSAFGNLTLYGNGIRYGRLQARNVTANRTVQIPDASGTLALIEDIEVNRVTKDCNTLAKLNRTTCYELNPESANLPDAYWYYAVTFQGADSDYASQILIGQTTAKIWFRMMSGGTWDAWRQIF